MVNTTDYACFLLEVTLLLGIVVLSLVWHLLPVLTQITIPNVYS